VLEALYKANFDILWKFMDNSILSALPKYSTFYGTLFLLGCRIWSQSIHLALHWFAFGIFNNLNTFQTASITLQFFGGVPASIMFLMLSYKVSNYYPIISHCFSRHWTPKRSRWVQKRPKCIDKCWRPLFYSWLSLFALFLSHSHCWPILSWWKLKFRVRN
jgi:hypothetical protein